MNKQFNKLLKDFNLLSKDNQETFFGMMESDFLDLVTEVDGINEELKKFLLNLKDLFQASVEAGLPIKSESFSDSLQSHRAETIKDLEGLEAIKNENQNL